MKRSAADFLPSFMKTFMNFANISLLNLGSGRMVRTGAWARFVIGSASYLLVRFVPYFVGTFLRSPTPAQSSVPRTVW